MPGARRCFTDSVRWLALPALIVAADSASPQSGYAFEFSDKAVSRYAEASRSPARECSSLMQATTTDYSVLSARMVPANGDVPDHCRVFGLAGATTRFELNLPSRWNGRLYQHGTGGFAGYLPDDDPWTRRDRARGLARHFATVMGDGGHDARLAPGGTFARDNLQGGIDYGYRAQHIVTVAAKSLVADFYGVRARYSYFDGCSNGGREALMTAERFPEDFEGIVAGAPYLNPVGRALQSMNEQRAFSRGVVTLTDEQIKAHAQALYAKCDAADGAEDGLISDPDTCTFSVAESSRVCDGGAGQGDCLSAEQAEALKRYYSPLVVGDKTLYPGFPYGTVGFGRVEWIDERYEFTQLRESGWYGYRYRPVMQIGTFERDFFRYLAFDQDRADLELSDLEVTPALLEQTQTVESIMNPQPQMMSAFLERNGRLLMWHGWADPMLNAKETIRFYEAMDARLEPALRDRSRLYVIPGVYHCSGGVGPSLFDHMTPLIDWVEKGVPPASQVIYGAPMPGDDSGAAARATQLVCPWPQRAVYSDSGDVHRHESFACAGPRARGSQ